MTDAPQTDKPCPDCGETVPAAAGLCRHCGYVFPQGRAARSGPVGLTKDLAEPAAETGAAPEWTRLLWPLVPLAIVAAVLVAIVGANRTTVRWDAAVQKLPAAQSYDAEFEQLILSMYASDGINVDVRAANGQCLINLRDVSGDGMLSRLAGKLSAFAVACQYAGWRRAHQDSPVATTILFANGNRHSDATCDGVAHPELLR